MPPLPRTAHTNTNINLQRICLARCLGCVYVPSAQTFATGRHMTTVDSASPGHTGRNPSRHSGPASSSSSGSGSRSGGTGSSGSTLYHQSAVAATSTSDVLARQYITETSKPFVPNVPYRPSVGYGPSEETQDVSESPQPDLQGGSSAPTFNVTNSTSQAPPAAAAAAVPTSPLS